MKKIIALAIAATAFGCIASHPIANGVDSLDAEDIGSMVHHAMNKIYAGVGKGRIVGRAPNVRIVAKMQPFEILSLPTDTRAKEVASELETRLCEAMTDGGRFLFVNAAGEVAPGVALPPDCILKGRLSCLIREEDGRSTSEFKLHVAIVDVRTGSETWKGTVPLVKRYK